MLAGNIFVYHLDSEIQRLFNLERQYGHDKVRHTLTTATRIAYLLCRDSLLVPASNYFESRLTFDVIESLRPLSDIGGIQLISGSRSLDELLLAKSEQHGPNFRSDRYQYKEFHDGVEGRHLPFPLARREGSASADIRAAWVSSPDSLMHQMARLSGSKSDVAVERSIALIPELLGKTAYLSTYIVPLLNVTELTRHEADVIVNEFVTREYIRSYLHEYDAAYLRDIPFIPNSILPQKGRQTSISYRDIAQLLYRRKHTNQQSAFQHVAECEPLELLEFKHSPLWHEMLEIVKDRSARLEGTGSTGTGTIMYGTAEHAVSVFISHAPEDRETAEQLELHLSPLRRTRMAEAWHEGHAGVGKERDREVHEHLDGADIVILLVTPHFLDSDDCYGVQMQKAIRRMDEGRARVVAVIAEYCLWEPPPLKNLTVVPKSKKPVSAFENRNEAFLEIATAVQTMAIESKREKTRLPLTIRSEGSMGIAGRIEHSRASYPDSHTSPPPMQ